MLWLYRKLPDLFIAASVVYICLMYPAQALTKGRLFKCEMKEFLQMAEGGVLEETPFSEWQLKYRAFFFFDEATGTLRTNNSELSWSYRLVQIGNSENSTVAVREYKGEASYVVQVLRILTWKDRNPYIHVDGSDVSTGVCTIE